MKNIVFTLSKNNFTITSVTFAAIILLAGVLAISGTLTPAYAVPLGFSWLKGCTSPVNVGSNLDCEASAQYAPSQTHTFELLNAVDCINGLASEVGLSTAITCSNVSGGDTPVTTVPFGTTSDKVTISGVTGNAKCSGGSNNQLPCIIAKGGTSGTIDGLLLPADANNGEVDFADTSYAITTTTFTYAGASTHILHDQIGLVWIDKSDALAENNNYAAGGSANVLQLTPTLATLSSQTGTPSVPISSVSDSGTISGTAGIPTGTVIFTLVDHSNGDVTVGGPTAPATLDGAGTASSGSVSPSTALVAGDQYCWNMDFTPSGANTNYKAASETGSSNEATECFTPQPITPTLATLSSKTGTPSVPISSVSDSGTISGTAGIPTGTVIFTLVDHSNGDATVGGPTAAATLDGAGTASSGSVSPSTALVAGDQYCWNMDFTPSGANPNYVAASETGSSNEATECFTPQPITPTLATLSSKTGTPILPIASVSDSGTISGTAGIPTGTVIFTLVDHSNGDATVGGPTAAATLDGAGTASSGSVSPSPALVPGDQYCWNMDFTPSGANPNYVAASETGSSNAATECFTPHLSPATLATSATPVGNPTLPISSVSDSATVTGGSGTATGSVVFTLVDTSNANAIVAGPTSSIPLVAGAASSGSLTPSLTASHKYCWNLDYTPDASSPYSGASEIGSANAATECFTPQPAQPVGDIGTIGFWKNWGNHFNNAQITTITNWVVTNNAPTFNGLQYSDIKPMLTPGGAPQSQKQLMQFVATKFDVSLTANVGVGGIKQFNDKICLPATVNVAGLNSATQTFLGASGGVTTLGKIITAMDGITHITHFSNPTTVTFSPPPGVNMGTLATMLDNINSGSGIVTSNGCP